MVRMWCWNIAHRHKAWRCIPDSGVDVVLVQEGYRPPCDVEKKVEVDPAPYEDENGKALSRCAIIRVSDGVEVEYLKDVYSSHRGCLSAAIVTPRDKPDRAFLVVNFCAEFEAAHPASGLKTNDLVDPSVHRIISDISLLIGRKNTFRMIAAGDTTVMQGDGPNFYWKRRNAAVFDRMFSIGLPVIGPNNGPTYYHPLEKPATATRQLDYVFASKSMLDSVSTRALNTKDEWGPSDHCRILIEVD